MRKKLAFGLLAGLIAGTPASAELVTIDFESLPAMNTFVSGNLIPAEARLHDQLLASHGVLFSSGSAYVAVVPLGVGHATSGSNGIGGSTADGILTYNAAYPITISFFDVANPGVMAVTDFVSLRGDQAGTGGELSVSLSAYDVFGVLLGTDTQPDVGGQTLSVSFAGIHSVVFSGVPVATFGGQGGVGGDDLSFDTPAPVPLPPAWFLLASALGTLKCRRYIGFR